MTEQINQTDQAVASGNAYELIKKRLSEQGTRLESQTATLNQARLDEFGNSQMAVIARTRIRTENNCVARDMVQVGDYMLFGYNVFMGLKQETHIDDVLSVYQIIPPATEGEEYQLAHVDWQSTFLNQSNFRQDFDELYRYYKQTQLLQLIIKDGKLLIAFQIGERVSDIRVFRFGLSADATEVTYIDNRGERDIELPPAYDFEWTETTREQMVNGKHPHMNILDTLFVETVGGSLTIKVEDNTESGLGIYSEPVEDKTQSLTDAEIYYAKVGSLILLKILPYREEAYRYLVYNTLTEGVLRLDAIGQSCVQLPEDHGIVFPGGYYLQTGEHKLFEASTNSDNFKFKRRIISPNGEDVLFLFYDVTQGMTGLFAYNLIKKELQNPIYCHGYALSESGQLVLFNAENEPTRIHPVQIWQTPYASQEFVSKQPESTSFYGKIGNKELVRGISDIYSVTRLIANQTVSQKLYEELSSGANSLFDSYYWLAEPELGEIAGTIKEVTATAELVIDEFAKVQSIQKQTQKAIADAETKQNEILRQIRITSFETADDYVRQLGALRQQKGHLASLENLRYLDKDKLTTLVNEVDGAEAELAEETVSYLSGTEALASYEGVLADINNRLNTASTNAELTPVLETIDSTAQGLDLLTELLGTLDVADATVRTQIIDDISAIYAKLNQYKASLNHKRKNLGGAEAVAQFGAQFKLFSQSITNALSVANTPEKCDEQLAKLLVQLEELESQFSDFDQFLGDIISKREEIYETFDNHKQQLLDDRNRKAQNLGDGALRMLESIKKRTQATGVTGFTDEESLNTYFASDGLVQKVKSIAKELAELGFSVKSDDIDARLKAIQTDSYKNLRDKSELFEAGGNVIKLGKHKFSVNTQPLDLTLLTRQMSNTKGATGAGSNGKTLNLHLTGTDYYEVLENQELNALKSYWDMSTASETPTVYRGEYLAYSIIESAKTGQDGLSLAMLNQAYEQSVGADGLSSSAKGKDWEDGLMESPLAELVKTYATPRYKLGYEKGIHDHDATRVLMQILPVLNNAGLLIYEPAVRALAQIFYWQMTTAKQLIDTKSSANSLPKANLENGQAKGLEMLANFAHGAWLDNSTLTQASTWKDRAITARQLQSALNSDKAKNLLIMDIAKVLGQFVEAYTVDTSAHFEHGSPLADGESLYQSSSLFTKEKVLKASEYLANVLGEATDNGTVANWQTSQKAQDLCNELQQTLTTETQSHFTQAVSKLALEPRSAYELVETWLIALIEQKVAKVAKETETQQADQQNSQTTEPEADQLDPASHLESHAKRRFNQLAHYVPEAVAIILTQIGEVSTEQLVTMTDIKGTHKGMQSKPMAKQAVATFERSISQTSLDIEVTGLLGDHSIIHQQSLSFALDSFLSRLHQHHSQTIPAYERYLALRSRILHEAKENLRLEEFMPRPLSSFVRNRLINESYLPIIGDNLAKQMGTVGDNKRTDLMGLLMMISPPGYGKTTLMEYVASRLGLIFMKINCPSLGHEVTSLDPAKAPNATAVEELKKINLAFEMGNNVMLYLDDIQHTHPEFLQKFISLCDGTRRIDGVWQDKTKTYDMRGKKFCVVMAGNPYTESGESFQVPDMLANRADIYNLGDILGGMEEVFALSYIENALTSNAVLTPMANRDMQDVYKLIRLAKGENVNTSELSYPYSGAEINEITSVLQKMFAVQEVILKVNQQYIASASQDDKYRVEPVFKLQGSYRNMNKMTEKLSAVMNENELNQLIDDHYLGESQLLTTGAESNLLKLAEMRGVLNDEQQQRWQQIKADFMRNKAMGGDDSDTGNKIVAQLVDIVTGFNAVSDSIDSMTDNMSQMTEASNQQHLSNITEDDKTADKTTDTTTEQDIDQNTDDETNYSQLDNQLAQQALLMSSIEDVSNRIAQSIDNGFENSISKLVTIYQHDHKTDTKHLQENHQLMRELMVNLVNAVQQLSSESNKNNQDQTSPLGTNSPQTLESIEANRLAEQQQVRLLAKAINQALEPFLTSLNEHLDKQRQLDKNTENSGKLIVSNLQRLSDIMEAW